MPKQPNVMSENEAIEDVALRSETAANVTSRPMNAIGAATKVVGTMTTHATRYRSSFFIHILGKYSGTPTATPGPLRPFSAVLARFLIVPMQIKIHDIRRYIAILGMGECLWDFANSLETE